MNLNRLHIIWIFLSILAIFFIVLIHQKNNIEIELANKCSENSPGGTLFIVVEASDTLFIGDKSFIEQDINHIISQSSIGTNIILLQPNPTSSNEPHTYFTMCTTWKDDALYNFISSNSDKERMQNLKHQFLDSVQHNLSNIFRRQVTKRSPIMETLIFIAKDYKFTKSKKNRVYVYSDMLQNSDKLSWYYIINNRNKNKVPNFTVFDSTRFEKVDFKKSNVNIKFFPRFGSHVRKGRAIAKSDSEVKSFWLSWIKSNNGEAEWR